MNKGKILGLIIAFDLDRDGNEFVIRGSLEFFNKPIIMLTNEILSASNINNIVIYTNPKGIIFKNILGKNVKYIVRKNNYLYTSNNISKDFDGLLNNIKDILIVDPKYPFLDEKVIKELLLKHKHCCSDLTYIKGIYNDIVNIPNIFVIDKDLFLDIFNNEFYPKNIDINKVIDSCLSKQKFLQFIDPVYVYKISTVSNQKSLDDLEMLLINRK